MYFQVTSMFMNQACTLAADTEKRILSPRKLNVKRSFEFLTELYFYLGPIRSHCNKKMHTKVLQIHLDIIKIYKDLKESTKH